MSTSHRPLVRVVSFVSLVLFSPSLHAQCGEWVAPFVAPGPEKAPIEWAAHDDGTGPAAYAIGDWASASGTPMRGVLRWNGTSWSEVGTSFDGVKALAVFDDGSGAKLYAAGVFTVVGGAPANTIARWNGTSWAPLPGPGPDGVNDQIFDLVVGDLGQGLELFAAGAFGVPGLSGIQEVARWGATGWTPTANLPGLIGERLVVRRSGPTVEIDALVSGTLMRFALGAWAPIGGTLNGSIADLEVFDSGGGEDLYVGGQIFSIAGITVNGVARWDGASWSGLAGPGGVGLAQPSVAWDLDVQDDGTGTALYVAGTFASAGGLPIASIARWNGAAWSAVAPAPTFPSTTGPADVTSLARIDDGGGPALFIGGEFGLGAVAGGGEIGLAHAARWRAGSWDPLGAGAGLSSHALDVCTFDDGSGEALYVAGRFLAGGTTPLHGLGRWNGSSWSSVGAASGADGTVRGVAVLDFGGQRELYAFGDFDQMGGVTVHGLARWNGTSWSDVGGGVDGWVDDGIVFDDGTGPALYIGGQFALAGGSAANNVARWNGTSWSAVGGGTNGEVRKLVAVDLGAGPELDLIGTFTTAGGQPLRSPARWNGTAFSALPGIAPNAGAELVVLDTVLGRQVYLLQAALPGGGGLAALATWSNGVASMLVPYGPELVHSLTSFDFGSGPLPCAFFSDGVSARLRSFDGVNWTDRGTLEWRTTQSEIGWAYVPSAAAFDPEHDGVPDLYAVGTFRRADGLPVANIASFVGCGTIGSVACAGDGSAAACPCGNFGAQGHGCANSVHTNGGLLANAGLASLSHDTLRLVASELPNSTALFFQGTTLQNGGAGVAFGDGLLCPAGTLVRLGARPIAAGSTSMPPTGGQPLSQRGSVSLPGSVRFYQAQYRNSAPFCTSATSNGTNALAITWTL